MAERATGGKTNTHTVRTEVRYISVSNIVLNVRVLEWCYGITSSCPGVGISCILTHCCQELVDLFE